MLIVLIGTSNTFNLDSGLSNKILGNFKNINYETKNVDLYKDETTSEIFGALGYLTQINLRKKRWKFKIF